MLKGRLMLRTCTMRNGRIGWKLEEPEILWLTKRLAVVWMIREYNRKGKIKGGPWKKGSGIIGEMLFEAMLNQSEVAHIRSMPLLERDHPVNVRKNYDFKIGDRTIDIKTTPPKRSWEESLLNVNCGEVEKYGPCDFYILIELNGDLTDKEIGEALLLDEELTKGPKLSREEFNRKRIKLEKIIDKISSAIFTGWATKEDLINPENIKPGPYGAYYSLTASKISIDFNNLDIRLNVNLFRDLFKSNPNLRSGDAS